MKILLLKGGSQYGALRNHIDQLAYSFKKIGQKPIIFDFVKENNLNELVNVMQNGVNFVYSFNAMGVNISVNNGISIYNALNIPFITSLVDHPKYHLERLDNDIKKSAVTLLDHSHIDYLKQNNNFWKIISFLTPGGSYFNNETDFETYKEFKNNREVSILFTGTYRGRPERSWNKNISNSAFRKILNNVCDESIANPLKPISQSYDKVVSYDNFYFKKDFNKEIKNSVLQQVGRFIESYWRHMCFKVLGENNIEINIYGKGWNDLSKEYSSFNYLGKGSMKKTLKLLKKTKLTLNINNNFVNGGHERVFNSMINGSAVLTDSNNYYKKEFKNDSNIFTYNLNSLKTLPIKINHILKNEKKVWEIATEGKKVVSKFHSWEEKAKMIINLYKLLLI